jgi:hypothetical protein
MYRRECPLTYREKQLASGQLALGNGFLSFIGSIADLADSDQVGELVNLMFKLKYEEFVPTKETPGETFASTDLEGKAMSMELGIAMENVEEVLDLLLNAKPEIEVYAGVFSFRYVKRSRATLGFTRFDPTCAVEFNAAFNDRTIAYYERVWNDLEARGIPYTLHWGQMNNFAPDRVRTMYGNAVDKWLNARRTLLSADVRRVFTNEFLERAGLTD